VFIESKEKSWERASYHDLKRFIKFLNDYEYLGFLSKKRRLSGCYQRAIGQQLKEDAETSRWARPSLILKLDEKQSCVFQDTRPCHKLGFVR
jgi:hypothetical protein